MLKIIIFIVKKKSKSVVIPKLLSDWPVIFWLKSIPTKYKIWNIILFDKSELLSSVSLGTYKRKCSIQVVNGNTPEEFYLVQLVKSGVPNYYKVKTNIIYML